MEPETGITFSLRDSFAIMVGRGLKSARIPTMAFLFLKIKSELVTQTYTDHLLELDFGATCASVVMESLYVIVILKG